MYQSLGLRSRPSSDGKRRGVLLAALVLGVVGCGGEEPQRVRYEVIREPPLELVFPHSTLGDTSLARQKFTESIPTERNVAFTGELSAPSLKRTSGSLRITKEQKGKRVTMRSVQVTFTKGEGEDRLRFHAELLAPRLAGRYQVDITVGDALVAMGEIAVVPK